MSNRRRTVLTARTNIISVTAQDLRDDIQNMSKQDVWYAITSMEGALYRLRKSYNSGDLDEFFKKDESTKEN